MTDYALKLVSGAPRMVALTASPSIYDQYIDVASPISTGTAVTLPNSGSYTSSELEVYLNGIRIDNVLDFNYVGSGTRTQISFTFDLIVNDRIRFRIDRGA